MANTSAYFALLSVRKKKSFMPLTPGYQSGASGLEGAWFLRPR
jgi:hypothetical protein